MFICYYRSLYIAYNMRNCEKLCMVNPDKYWTLNRSKRDKKCTNLPNRKWSILFHATQRPWFCSLVCDLGVGYTESRIDERHSWFRAWYRWEEWAAGKTVRNSYTNQQPQEISIPKRESQNCQPSISFSRGRIWSPSGSTFSRSAGGQSAQIRIRP